MHPPPLRFVLPSTPPSEREYKVNRTAGWEGGGSSERRVEKEGEEQGNVKERSMERRERENRRVEINLYQNSPYPSPHEAIHIFG